MHATEFLKSPPGAAIPRVVALAGTERFLVLGVLERLIPAVVGGEGQDLSVARYNGEELDWRTLSDALLTNSMWSPAQVVVVENADPFITECREQLEKYTEKPAKKSVLVLTPKTFPATTRLAKQLAKVGLVLDCNPLKVGPMTQWVNERARGRYQKTLEGGAAARLVDLVGCEFGQLDQELAKLTSYVGELPTITTAAVEKLVGGWKMETTWKMVDAARDGEYGRALELLDKLLVSGEAPLKLLGGIAFTFRPVAKAVDLVAQGQNVADALKTSGAKPFALDGLVGYCQRIGRLRWERIGAWLFEADRDLKGASPLAERIILERLLFRLTAPTPNRRAAGRV